VDGYDETPKVGCRIRDWIFFQSFQSFQYAQTVRPVHFLPYVLVMDTHKERNRTDDTIATYKYIRFLDLKKPKTKIMERPRKSKILIIILLFEEKCYDKGRGLSYTIKSSSGSKNRVQRINSIIISRFITVNPQVVVKTGFKESIVS
jgi:hypothetical protein